MLDSETKSRIDSARNMLVGKVPDPKSQVEQITIAMIYKFMDDMDAEAEELGGMRTFFAGEYAKFGWAKLIRTGLAGHEMLALYSNAISSMTENPGLPTLFRDIFKNAYLPYRDPETLRAFLKIINEFSYDHSEKLGDAFEYLLSILGSQGDAGQFRTPRHIIDFMVEVLAPKKCDVILDPACGTAGFLISAYKHILRSNTDKNGNSTLTPDEKGRLANNFKGYDISPDMVRLSLVNLYLHGFKDPHIFEYDTLTSEERWNEFADVILANPPFMSPKGGIKPHKRFSIKAKRSEVLFLDYMAEHLTPTGRAAIIVPEGIIFQSQTAYKELRKMLVDSSLVAVISLPAGCFNPYSGVKTSILILDKSIAKTADSIAFFKVDNDGFGLGAQRRAFDKNDLPQVQAELECFLQAIRESRNLATLELACGQVVSKAKLAVNGDYNLSGERYREGIVRSGQHWPIVSLSDVCTLQRGISYSTAEIGDERNGIPFYNLKSIKRQGVPQRNDFKYFTGEVKDRHLVKPGDVLIALTDLTPTSELIGSPKLISDPIKAAYSADLGKLVFKDSTAQPQFLYHLLRSTHYREYIVTYSHGANVKHLQSDGFYALQIPLPPLDVQKEIVAEIEGYQKVINGARAVLDNYRPHISVKAEWPVVRLADVCEAIVTGPFGSALHQSDYVDDGIPVINPANIVDGIISTEGVKMVSPTTRDNLKEFTIRKDDIVIGRRGEMGRCGVVTSEMNGWLCGTGSFVIRLKEEYLARFAYFLITSPKIKQYLEEQAIGVTMKNLNQGILSSIQMPLPPLDIQQVIVEEIEAEQTLVAANKELIARMEKKIQGVLARVWGEDL